VAGNPKTRTDDARGTPPGAGTVEGANGGRIGNPPFTATDEQRARVRQLAKVFPVHAEHLIARMMGFSRDTLRRHFADEMELGRAEMLAAVGSQMIARAMDADARTAEGKSAARGDLDAQKFILARLGGWTTKVEVGEKAAAPYGGAVPDLSRFNEEELAEYGRLAAIAEGADPDEVGDADRGG
jgi:hypothetical protein